jgi:hypothetical protein
MSSSLLSVKICARQGAGAVVLGGPRRRTLQLAASVDGALVYTEQEFGVQDRNFNEVVKQYLAEPGFFEPAPQWNTDRTNDRQWS